MTRELQYKAFYVLKLKALTFYETKWKSRSSWAPKQMCMYECRCFFHVCRSSAEQWDIALLRIFKVYYNANTSLRFGMFAP